MLEDLNTLRALIGSISLPAGIILLVHANETKWGLILLGIALICIITVCI